jgi:hypothetical protein
MAIPLPFLIMMLPEIPSPLAYAVLPEALA